MGGLGEESNMTMAIQMSDVINTQSLTQVTRALLSQFSHSPQVQGALIFGKRPWNSFICTTFLFYFSGTQAFLGKSSPLPCLV